MASEVRNQKYEFRLYYSLVFFVPLPSPVLLPSSTTTASIWKRTYHCICIASRYLQLTRYPHFQFPIHNCFNSRFTILNSQFRSHIRWRKRLLQVGLTKHMENSLCSDLAPWLSFQWITFNAHYSHVSAPKILLACTTNTLLPSIDTYSWLSRWPALSGDNDYYNRFMFLISFSPPFVLIMRK